MQCRVASATGVSNSNVHISDSKLKSVENETETCQVSRLVTNNIHLHVHVYIFLYGTQGM